MNIYQIYGMIAPWATPAPAALSLGMAIFAEYEARNFVLAIVAAVLGLVAMETVGGLCSYQAIRTSRQKQWGWFALCVLGVAAYLALGVYTLMGQTAWIYVVWAVFTHIAVASELDFSQAAKIEASNRAWEAEQLSHNLAMSKQETARARAAARAASKQTLDSQLLASLSQLEPATEKGAPTETVSCQVCGEGFKTVFARNAHMRKHKNG